MDTSIAPGPSNTGPPPPSLADDTRSKRPAAVSHKARIRIEEAEEEEEETDDLDRLPNKKFRSLFFGSVLPPSSQLSTQPMTSQEVLASDSEEET